MEESPHLAGDQFYPRSSNNSGGNLDVFLSERSSVGAVSPPREEVEKDEENPGEEC